MQSICLSQQVLHLITSVCTIFIIIYLNYFLVWLCFLLCACVRDPVTNLALPSQRVGWKIWGGGGGAESQETHEDTFLWVLVLRKRIRLLTLCVYMGVFEVLSPLSINLCVRVYCELVHHPAAGGMWKRSKKFLPISIGRKKPQDLSVHQIQLPLILLRESRCTWPISAVHSPCSTPTSKHGSREGGGDITTCSLWV